MAQLAQVIANLAMKHAKRSATTTRLVLDHSPRVNPGNLEMFLYKPEGLPPGAPIVVVLHGCTQNAAGYAEGSGWLTLAERFGFAVLAPGQVSANNPNGCFNWFLPEDTTRGLGEAASICEMIGLAVDRFRTDPRRVFITGLSAGGAMTSVMLATYPELFRGGSVIAGLAYGAATSMVGAFAAMQGRPSHSSALRASVRDAANFSGPWPEVLVWHGDADVTVRISAGEQVARQWAEVHGVADNPIDRTTKCGRRYSGWETSSGRTVVEFHRIVGMGHGTPLKTGGRDGCGHAAPFLLDVGISSSLETALRWEIAQDSNAAEVMDKVALDPEILDASAGLRISHGLDASSDKVSSTPNISAIINDALRKAGLLR